MHRLLWICLGALVALTGGCASGPGEDLLERSKHLLEDGRYAEAIELQTRHIRRCESGLPDKSAELAYACFWRGYTYDLWKDALKSRRRSNPAAARYAGLAAENYEQAAKADPDFVEAHFNLALLRFDEQRWDEAVALFEKALELSPAETDALGYIAEIHFRRGDYAAAAGTIERFMSASARESLKEARRLNRSGDIEGAVRQLNAALDIRPDMPEAHLELGLINLLKRRDLSRALHHLKKVEQLSQDEALKRGVKKLIEEIKGK